MINESKNNPSIGVICLIFVFLHVKHKFCEKIHINVSGQSLSVPNVIGRHEFSIVAAVAVAVVGVAQAGAVADNIYTKRTKRSYILTISIRNAMGIDDGCNNIVLTMVILFKFVTPDIVRFRYDGFPKYVGRRRHLLGRRFSLKTLLCTYIIIYVYGVRVK